MILGSTIWVCLKMLCTPLYPMVLLIIIPFLNGYFIGNIPNIFRQTHIWLIIIIIVDLPIKIAIYTGFTH